MENGTLLNTLRLVSTRRPINIQFACLDSLGTVETRWLIQQ